MSARWEGKKDADGPTEMPVVSNHGEINNVSEISKELKELSAAELLWPSRRYLIFNIYILWSGGRLSAHKMMFMTFLPRAHLKHTFFTRVER